MAAEQGQVRAASPTVAAGSAMPARRAGPDYGARRQHSAVPTGTAGPTGPTGAERGKQLPVGPSGAPVPAMPATPERSGNAGAAGPARPARTAAEPPVGPSCPAVPARGAGEGLAISAGPAVTAMAPQARRPAVPAGLPEPAGSTVAAVADQPPAVSACLSGSRSTIGPVADQRSPRQQLDGPGRQPQALDLPDERRQRVPIGRRNIDRLRGGILPRARRQRLHELVMEKHRLCAERLKLLRVVAEHSRNRCRNLILRCGDNRCRRARRHGICRPDRRSDPG